MCNLCFMGSAKRIGATFSIFFCKHKEHGDSRAPLADLKTELEKYIGKLRTAIVDSSIQFTVNFMFQSLINNSASSLKSSHGFEVFPPAPSIDSETGLQVQCEDANISPESMESSIYLMQNLRIGDSNSHIL